MPRCKNPNCKDKFKPKVFLQKYCLEKDECIRLAYLDKKEKVVKDKVDSFKIDTHSKENKNALQKEINLLARKIDALFYDKCICCGRDYGKQTDACHYHSVGSNSSLRFNLHNLHSGSSYCNNFSNTHLVGYKEGLIKRYGNEYAKIVESLPNKYKSLKISNLEVSEKLKLVRQINRSFDTYQFFDGVSARNIMNKLIGLY